MGPNLRTQKEVQGGHLQPLGFRGLEGQSPTKRKKTHTLGKVVDSSHTSPRTSMTTQRRRPFSASPVTARHWAVVMPFPQTDSPTTSGETVSIRTSRTVLKEDRTIPCVTDNGYEPRHHRSEEYHISPTSSVIGGQEASSQKSRATSFASHAIPSGRDPPSSSPDSPSTRMKVTHTDASHLQIHGERPSSISCTTNTTTTTPAQTSRYLSRAQRLCPSATTGNSKDLGCHPPRNSSRRGPRTADSEADVKSSPPTNKTIKGDSGDGKAATGSLLQLMKVITPTRAKNSLRAVSTQLKQFSDIYRSGHNQSTLGAEPSTTVDDQPVPYSTPMTLTMPSPKTRLKKNHDGTEEHERHLPLLNLDECESSTKNIVANNGMVKGTNVPSHNAYVVLTGRDPSPQSNRKM